MVYDKRQEDKKKGTNYSIRIASSPCMSSTCRSPRALDPLRLDHRQLTVIARSRQAEAPVLARGGAPRDVARWPPSFRRNAFFEPVS